MKKIAGVIVLMFLLGCSFGRTEKIQATNRQPTTYDQNSWKTVMADNCQAFFDGCNNCSRSKDTEHPVCTRKACASYSKPVCFDEKKRNAASSDLSKPM